jgi:hypothetical protein
VAMGVSCFEKASIFRALLRRGIGLGGVLR